MLFRLIKIDRQILKEEESRQLINKINIFLRKWWKHLSIKWSMLPSCGNLSMRVTPPCPPCSLPLPGCLLFRLSVGSISQFREIVPFYGWASPDPLWQNVGASVQGCLVSCRDQWRIRRQPWVWRFRGFLSVQRLYLPCGRPAPHSEGRILSMALLPKYEDRFIMQILLRKILGRLVGALIGFEPGQHDWIEGKFGVVVIC